MYVGLSTGLGMLSKHRHCYGEACLLPLRDLTSACFSFASLTENRQDSGTALPKSALALKGRQGGMTSQRFPEVSNLPPRPKEVVSDYRVL